VVLNNLVSKERKSQQQRFVEHWLDSMA